MTVFADTFALIAWLNPRDDAHAIVAAYLDSFTGRLLTTEWVRGFDEGAVVIAQARLKDAVGLVLYELWMLRECAHMPKPAKQVPRNLWYEGLVLHSRVIRDFFFTKLDEKGKRATRKEDIVAVNYFATQSAWPYTSRNLPPYLEQNRQRMDRALAHLSFDRLDYEDKDWSPSHLLSEVGAKWFEFIEKLEHHNEPAAAWFRGHRRARLIPFLPPL